MPVTLHDFAAVAEGAPKTDHIHASGKGVEAVDGSGLRNRIRERLGANGAAKKSFQRALEEAYGPEITYMALKEADIALKGKDGSPLLPEQVTTALQVAADCQYVVQYDQRNRSVADWTPATSGASFLDPSENPGLRYSCADQGEVRLHAWHLCQDPDAGTTELDDLLSAEMALLPGDMDTPRKNIQARINLLGAMVQEAERHLGPGDTPHESNIFTAPEWLFAGMREEQGGNGERRVVSAGAVTAGEKEAIERGLKALSQEHPQLTIVAGTILWSQPLDGMHAGKGAEQPADMVYNHCPVLANGQIIHSVAKHTDGGDAKMAAMGFDPARRAHDVPGSGNSFGARIQVFSNDAEAPDKKNPKSLAGLAAESQRPPPLANNFFALGSKTVCLEICADHPAAVAKNALMSEPDGTESDLIKRVKAAKGTDLHLVIAAGSKIAAGNVVAKVEGVACVNDLNEGKFESARRGEDFVPIGYGKDEEEVRLAPVAKLKADSFVKCSPKESGLKIEEVPHPVRKDYKRESNSTGLGLGQRQPNPPL